MIPPADPGLGTWEAIALLRWIGQGWGRKCRRWREVLGRRCMHTRTNAPVTPAHTLLTPCCPCLPPLAAASPPILGFTDVEFAYPGGPVLFTDLNFG